MNYTPTPNLIPAAAREQTAAAIEEVVKRVESLNRSNILEHVEAFEHAHQVLQERLNEAANG